VFNPLLPAVPSVDPADVTGLMNDGALLIDIREKKEWDESRIPGADFKPMSEINGWWQQLPRDRTVILYCRTGNRSAQATHALVSQAGFDNVLNLTGGIVEWAQSGLPMEA
jgi:rhodanese-related sulfurtransferase